MRRAPLILLVLFGACDDGSTSATDASIDPDALGPTPDASVADVRPVDASDAATEPDAAGPDLTEAVFDKTHLIDVAIEIDEDDYEQLRDQGRTGLDRRGADCLDAPFPSPYSWFSARVTVDGATYENVGIRKKGFFGSLSRSKPSFKIRFDKFVEDQTHESLTRLTLNNSRQDPSLFRTCLAYDVFTRAG